MSSREQQACRGTRAQQTSGGEYAQGRSWAAQHPPTRSAAVSAHLATRTRCCTATATTTCYARVQRWKDTIGLHRHAPLYCIRPHTAVQHEALSRRLPPRSRCVRQAGVDGHQHFRRIALHVSLRPVRQDDTQVLVAALAHRRAPGDPQAREEAVGAAPQPHRQRTDASPTP